jgi:hypothetical protein
MPMTALTCFLENDSLARLMDHFLQQAHMFSEMNLSLPLFLVLRRQQGFPKLRQGLLSENYTGLLPTSPVTSCNHLALTGTDAPRMLIRVKTPIGTGFLPRTSPTP